MQGKRIGDVAPCAKALYRSCPPRKREGVAIKTKPRLHVIAIGVLVGWTAFAVRAIFLLRPEPPPCLDERPGLWLRFGGERPQLSGRAPAAAKAIAVIVAVDFGAIH